MLLLVFSIGCTQNIKLNVSGSDCAQLKENLDITAYFGLGDFNCAEKDAFPIWVGGILRNITKSSATGYNRDEYRMTFEGVKKSRTIAVSIFYSNSKELPYEIGKFYSFDLRKHCTLMTSSASSGMFYDPDLNALEHLEECDTHA